MSNLSSGTGMRAWLEAAKADGPSAGARTKIWGAVSRASGAGVSAGLGTAGAAKMLVGGTLLGAAATVGLAATMIYMGGAVRTAKAAGGRPEVASHAVTVSASTGAGAGAAAGAGGGAGAGAAAGAIKGSGTAGAAHVRRSIPPEDALAREVALLDQARSALSRGDARAALRAVRAARDLPGGQLLPEELTVQKQALRSLGRIEQADAVEADLRAQYPESALAR